MSKGARTGHAGGMPTARAVSVGPRPSSRLAGHGSNDRGGAKSTRIRIGSLARPRAAATQHPGMTCSRAAASPSRSTRPAGWPRSTLACPIRRCSSSATSRAAPCSKPCSSGPVAGSTWPDSRTPRRGSPAGPISRARQRHQRQGRSPRLRHAAVISAPAIPGTGSAAARVLGLLGRDEHAFYLLGGSQPGPGRRRARQRFSPHPPLRAMPSPAAWPTVQISNAPPGPQPGHPPAGPTGGDR